MHQEPILLPLNPLRSSLCSELRCLIDELFVGNGGGVYAGTSVNSIVYFNMAASGSNWDAATAFTNSCTAPDPGGVGNTTSDPLFVDRGAGNYRLSAHSPCVNTGINENWMTNSANVHSKDLDGRARIRYGTVDMGAYECIYEGAIIRMW